MAAATKAAGARAGATSAAETAVVLREVVARAVKRRRWEEEKEAVARVWAAREAATLGKAEVGGEARAEAAMVVAAKEL